ncbi:MAG: hypothetical protein R3A46_02265 [Thermomicrobiales bacterium]
MLKSRSLLPRPQSAEPEDEVDDLAARLREYQQVKRMAAAMRDGQESGWQSFGPQASGPKRRVNVTLETPEPGKLRSLFVRALARQPAVPDIAPIRPVISVAEMARRFLSRAIRPGQRFRFFEFVESTNRQEIVAGFVALLSLWARRELDVSQDEMFGEIEFQASTASE